MANIQVGSDGSTSASGPGELPASLSLVGWEMILTPNGGYFVLNGPVSAFGIVFTLDPNNNITSLRFDSSVKGSSGFVPNNYWSVSQLSIPLALFESSLSNVMPLISGGDDIINGNSFNDILSGGSGVDTISGGDGDDVILPGYAGRYPSPLYYDNIDGGAGQDTISYADMTMAVTINLAAGTATLAQGDGAPPSARMVSIENATGGPGSDTITGNAGSNVLNGGAGNDKIYGGAGNDTLNGDAGIDWLFGGDGSDTLNGGDGNDILRGDAGADILDGGAGFDQAQYTTSTTGLTVDLRWGTTSVGDTLISIESLTGSSFADTLVGNAYINNLFGGAGNDTLWGFGGNDRIEGGAGNDNIYGGDGNDVIGGGDGNDAIRGEAGNDRLNGGNGNDQVLGGDGNDVIWADAGDDYVDAGAGNDFVVLGLGNDGFQLGAGDDRVRFDYGNGNDTIFDFGNGQDVIDFTTTDMNLAVLQANAVETAAGVLLNLGSGSILLSGLQLAQIEWNSDFVFAA